VLEQAHGDRKGRPEPAKTTVADPFDEFDDLPF
jgi:hypothetical protein